MVTADSAGLYGDADGNEGWPTDSQVARAEVLGRELEDVIRKSADLTGKQLPDLNRALDAKKLRPIVVMLEEEWRGLAQNR